MMSYYLITLINHQQADLFSYHNYNYGLRLANQKPNTNYIISLESVWNVEITILTYNNYTLLYVNITASTQFIDLKIWEFIFIIILCLHAKLWPNLKLGQKFCQKAYKSYNPAKRKKIKFMQPRYFGSKFRVINFKLQLAL